MAVHVLGQLQDQEQLMPRDVIFSHDRKSEVGQLPGFFFFFPFSF